MTKYIFPILYLNLGGEMCNIIKLRLHQQSIQPEKASKVIDDIIGTMCNKNVVKDMFQNPQTVLGSDYLQVLFKKLAHVSLMKVNQESMEKLLELMFISVKLQFIHCKDHTLLWTSALNRFDSLLKFSSSPETKESISYALKQYEEHFSKLSQGKVHAIRVGILNLLLDLRFKVSTFQRLELQNSDGDFILRPYNHQCSGGSIGQINYFDWNGEFTDGQKFIPTTRHQQTSGLLEGPNSRGTWLGMDIYDYDYPKTDHQMSNEKGDEAEPKRQPRILCNFEGETLAKNELGFLTRLIRPEHFERVQERAQESESVQANSMPLDCELNQTSHEKVQSSSAQYKETIQIVRRNMQTLDGIDPIPQDSLFDLMVEL